MYNATKIIVQRERHEIDEEIGSQRTDLSG